MTVLVGYATRHGSTKQVAQRIAGRLRGRGLEVDVLPLREVDDPVGYRAVVAGSAVHGQRWLPEGTAFLRRAAQAPMGGPVWLFSVGMAAALRGPWRRLGPMQGTRIAAGFPEAFSGTEHLVLSGVVLPDHLSVGGRLIFRAMGCRYGDHRDWPAVESWADGIAVRLSAG